MKTLSALLLFFMLCQLSFSQQRLSNETSEEKQERMEWWTTDRFGMFIHWGLYALPARHEWVKRREQISDEDYQKYFAHFNPDLYKPKEWAKKAKAAGMKYAVITTKHHDGFCLFDSQYTDFKATNTPYGKDLIAEWVEAFRAEGLKIGFYYSLIDWHHPQYTVDRVHPLSDKTEATYKRLNKKRDMSIYRSYLKNQVTELLTNYGTIDMIWLDYSFPTGKHGKGAEDWGAKELLKQVRTLQPKILINDRMDLKEYVDGGDFTTPEQYKVQKWPEINGKRVPWETCQTFSGSWGYYRDEMSWKDNKQLLELLIESVSKGGNVLLNVGPTGRGNFDYRADAALEGMGEWMKYNQRSIYGCTQAPEEFQTPANTRLTYNPKTNRLYIHLLSYPMGNIVLPNYKGKIEYIQFLHDASEIQMKTAHLDREEKSPNDVYLSLPIVAPNIEIPVIEIFLKK